MASRVGRAGTLPAAETGCYEAARAAALAGLPAAVVGRWARRRVVAPSAARERERLWSWTDLVALRLAWARVAAGYDPGQAAEEVAAALDGFDLEAAAGDGRARGGLVAVRRLLADPEGRLVAGDPAAASPGSTDLLGAFVPALPQAPAPAPALAPASAPVSRPVVPGSGRLPAQRLAGVTQPASPGKRRLEPAAPRHQAPPAGPGFGDLVAARRALGLPELPSTAGLGHHGRAEPDGFSRRRALSGREPAPEAGADEVAAQPPPRPEPVSGPGHGGPDLLRPRQGLRIVPGKVGGEPHLAGTRLTTRSIAALAARGLDPGQIAGLFPDYAKRAIAEAIDLERQLAVGTETEQ